MSSKRPDTLDDWYKTINKLYLDRNYYRHPESIFAHLVEIVGGLSLLASEKPKKGVDPQEYIAKALAWWFALCGKMRIRSVEDLIWAKYPSVCPYCLRNPHDDRRCKLYKLEHNHPDWEEVQRFGISNVAKKPRTLGGWLEMFNQIYPVNSQQENYSTIFARFAEELGELSEATRLFQLHPGYFFGEASDFFAWLMHLHTLYVGKNNIIGDTSQLIQDTLLNQYPGKCLDCGNEICTCPPVLKKTLGRIAHDLPLHAITSDHTPLLGLSEAMETFDLCSRTISIGGNQLNVDKELIHEIHDLSIYLQSHIPILLGNDAKTHLNLYDVLNQIKALSESERVTQDSINNLLSALSTLPKDQQSTILNLLTGVASSSLSAGVIEGIKSFLM